MIKLSKDLYVPERETASHISEPQMWRWFSNIRKEVEGGDLTDSEKEHILDYYLDVGLLKSRRRNFFRHHFSFNLAKATNYIFSHPRNPRILDLGCGIGTQSILYAMLGAKVVSIDLEHSALSILRKRQRMYQQMCDQELDITIYHSDTLDFDYSIISPLDAVFSMFAFNMMQPSAELLKRIAPALQPGGRVVIFDGNCCCWVQKVFPSCRRDTLSPAQLSQQLGDLGFITTQHEGGIAIPSLIWALTPNSMVRPINNILTKSWFFSVSHQIFAEKEGKVL